MSRDEIKSLLMRAAGGDLNQAEQVRLQELLNDDQHLDELAQLQREHTLLEKAVEEQEQPRLAEKQRQNVLAYAQRRVRSHKQKTDNKKPIPWILVRQLAAACLVIAVLFGMLGSLLMPSLSSSHDSLSLYKNEAPVRHYSVAPDNLEVNFSGSSNERSLEEIDITIEDEIIVDQPIITDLDVPVEELETESAEREERVEPKGREEALSKTKSITTDSFLTIRPSADEGAEREYKRVRDPITIPPLEPAKRPGPVQSSRFKDELKKEKNDFAKQLINLETVEKPEDFRNNDEKVSTGPKLRTVASIQDKNYEEALEQLDEIIHAGEDDEEEWEEAEKLSDNDNLLLAKEVELNEIQGHTNKNNGKKHRVLQQEMRQELQDVQQQQGQTRNVDTAGVRLEELSRKLEQAKRGNDAVAKYNYDQGLKAYAENRLEDAVIHLRVAVDASPNQEIYQKKLREVGAVAGTTGDPKDVFADNIADTLSVEHQRLLIEIEQNIDKGEKLLAEGELAQAKKYFNMAKVRTQNLPTQNSNREFQLKNIEQLLDSTDEQAKMFAATNPSNGFMQRQTELRDYNLRLEKNRIDAMMQRAERARKNRNYDEAILYAQNVLKINPSHEGAHDALIKNRRERHIYLRQITADLWDEEHLQLSERIEEDMLPQLELVKYSDEWHEIDARRGGGDGTQSALGESQTSAREILSEALNEARIGNYNQAAIRLNEALQENSDSKLLYQFYLAVGDRYMLKLAERDELHEPIKQILKRAHQYKKELRKSREYQKLLISKLMKSEEERLVATRELVAIGPEAVPVLVEMLKDANAEQKQYIVATLQHLSKRSEEARGALRNIELQKRQRQAEEAQRQEREMARRKAPVKNYPVNPWVQTKQDSLSTFAIDTDSASYRQARSYINRGYLPPAGLVRMEEFVNAFDYNYLRQRYKTFTVHTEAAASPYAQELTLVKVGIKGKVIGREERKAAHLVLAIDTSGSMDQDDRLPLVQDACLQLLEKLDARDSITLITYGRQARLLLESTPVSQKQKIAQTIQQLQCDSSTDLRQGLELAYKLAARHYKAGTVNRVILCSDGVANVGETDAQNLLNAVKAYKDQGITCTTVGVGNGVYNDELLERLANNGDGSYIYVDSADEARRVFSEELSATLQYIAKDVKIQVDFDPNVVRRYRLIGYENRKIADKDFRNDSVDAGEVGSGQSATALYEVELLNNIDANDLGTIYLRWKDVDTSKVSEEAHRIKSNAIKQRSAKSDPRFYLAAIAAEFAEILRESEHVSNRDLRKLLDDINAVADALPLDQHIQELKRLIQQAHGLPRGQ